MTSSASGNENSELRVLGIPGIPQVRTGDDLAELIVDAARRSGIAIEDGDILVVTQKIVSLAEGRLVSLVDIEASEVALRLTEGYNRDPRHTEIILRETRRIVRMDRGNIISETRHGFICANAGVDASNVPGEDTVVLLPLDPDASAQRILEGLRDRLAKDVAVIISDTFGRPWREGAVNVAIGVAGMSPVSDYRGIPDSFGHMMRTTVIAVADEIAATAELAMGKIKAIPVALLRGYTYEATRGEAARTGARALVRPSEKDMFR